MRIKTLAGTPSNAAWIAAMSFAMLILAASAALAGYSHRGAADLLYSRGYYNIQIVDADDDEYEIVACKGEWLYEIELKRNGRIDDVDREGRCHERHYGGYYSGDVHVSAPYAGVDVDRRGVAVDAPFTGVRVDRDRVRVRAPFVDLNIPRR